ncbi:hypothetical protein, partial [Pseudomonas sp. NPDC087614]|uniref:hypothetical protein n=1 Tax=Pseudomonas sp. NPDC087614 TaxID=3364442 RepID=UPI0037F5CDA7
SAKVICFIGKLGGWNLGILPKSESLFQSFLKGKHLEIVTNGWDLQGKRRAVARTEHTLVLKQWESWRGVRSSLIATRKSFAKAR